MKEMLVEAKGRSDFICNVFQLARKTIPKYWNELEPDEKCCVNEDEEFIYGLANMAATNSALFSKQLMRKFTDREGLSDEVFFLKKFFSNSKLNL